LSGDQDIDMSTLSKYHETNKIKIYEGLVARYIGEILLNLDDRHLSDAKDWITPPALLTPAKNPVRNCRIFSILNLRLSAKGKGRD